jgi:hypothetical protein
MPNRFPVMQVYEDIRTLGLGLRSRLGQSRGLFVAGLLIVLQPLTSMLGGTCDEIPAHVLISLVRFLPIGGWLSQGAETARAQVGPASRPPDRYWGY